MMRYRGGVAPGLLGSIVSLAAGSGLAHAGVEASMTTPGGTSASITVTMTIQTALGSGR